jgi:L-2,4-diaminobutyrate decarboxylase
MLETNAKPASAPEAKSFEGYFLAASEESQTAYREAIAAATEVAIAAFANRAQPYSGASPWQLAAELGKAEICGDSGQFLPEILQNIGENAIAHSAIVSHPRCIAHLHCPPLIPALAAEVLIAATNQSMDSWDQSPAATLVEQQLIGWLCGEFGYDAAGDGIFTSGGTQSNFMGMLLARDRYAKQHLNWSIQQQGLPPESAHFRILCSDAAHFTIRQACAHLGLGERAVVPVQSDRNYCISPTALEEKIRELKQQNLLPIALVGTVGTTDFGSIDPLGLLGEIARLHGLWFHVDAAYGGALVMSDRHCHKLAGIETADSIAVDFHKLFYQPISCGAFLLKDQGNFELMKLHADYLNPETNETEGIPDLVTKSVQTTRRFDALKLWISLQAVGRKAFGEMIDITLERATETAQAIAHTARLELANHPSLNAVVFRYLPQNTRRSNAINAQIRATLLQRGEAVLAQTRIAGETYLKFTLLNPRTQRSDIEDLLHKIQQLGAELDR